MTYPAVIFLIVLIWSLRWPKENTLYIMFGFGAFGSLAIFPPGWVGGINLLPGFAASLVLITRYAIDPRAAGPLVASAFRPSGMGLLTAFTFVAVLSAYFLPRIFADQVEVLPMRAATLAPLEPAMANVTQSGYIIISFLSAIVFQFAGSNTRFLETYLRAAILGGAVLILTGIIDFAVGSSGARAFIAPFKTAQYTYMDFSQVLGVRRVNGFMTEASAYGSACVGLASSLLFLTPIYPTARGRWWAQVISLGLILMAVLSTSSTAYVGLAILGVLYAVNLGRRIYASSPRGRELLKWELIGLVFVAMALALATLFNPEIFSTPWSFVDTLIFQKAKSESYTDRMTWNHVAMQALAGTGWVGVGVGSTRASNWIVAVLSNTGLLGGVLMFSFIALGLLKRPGNKSLLSRDVVTASKLTLVVSVVMATLAATTPDYGGMGGLLGLIVANSRQRQSPRGLGFARTLRPERL